FPRKPVQKMCPAITSHSTRPEQPSTGWNSKETNPRWRKQSEVGSEKPSTNSKCKNPRKTADADYQVRICTGRWAVSFEFYLVVLVLAVVGLYLVVPFAAHAYLRYRGKRIITCPETRRPAAVQVDARHAALTAAISRPELRLKTCSRWPEREDCGQECLLQVELSPEDCLVRNMLTSWYTGKRCVSC